jgi:Xaa-Pro aminopeptidase
MAKRLTTGMVLIGTPNLDPDILYATGFMAPDPIVYIKAGRKQAMVVSQLELGRAERTCSPRAIDVYTPHLLGIETSKRGDLAAWTLGLLKQMGINAISVPSSFPYGIACKLKAARIKVEVNEAAPFPNRRVKRADEIRNLRQSQRAAVIAMRAACALIQKSYVGRNDNLVIKNKPLTSEMVQRCIANVLLDHDCFCDTTIVAGGAQAVDPHERGHGVLKAHLPIVMDIFPRHLVHGYWGDITRTVVRGQPKPEVKRMYAAVKAAQTAALKLIRSGVSCAHVHQAAADEIKKRGFETRRENGHAVGFIHSTGHGVGLAVHEAPSLGTARLRLRAGDVVTVEPGLYYPKLGGIRIEDTIVVTREGWKYLAPCEKQFELQ